MLPMCPTTRSSPASTPTAVPIPWTPSSSSRDRSRPTIPVARAINTGRERCFRPAKNKVVEASATAAAARLLVRVRNLWRDGPELQPLVVPAIGGHIFRISPVDERPWLSCTRHPATSPSNDP